MNKLDDITSCVLTIYEGVKLGTKIVNKSTYALAIYIIPAPPKRKILLLAMVEPETFIYIENAIDLTKCYFSFKEIGPV